jgi:hypothetical protein
MTEKPIALSKSNAFRGVLIAQVGEEFVGHRPAGRTRAIAAAIRGGLRKHEDAAHLLLATLGR